MSCGQLTGDLKTNREESLTKHVWFVYAYAKKAKNRKILWWERWRQAEKARIILDNQKQDTFH